MLYTVLAALGLVTCIALAMHMALPWRARSRVDAALAHWAAWARRQMDHATGWRRRQRQTRAAALEAERVIRRARETALHEGGQRPEGEWHGNVYRPKSFEKPKKPH